MIAQIRSHTLRARLLIGASIGAMLFTGVAEAQSGRGRGGAANPAEAAVRAAQAQANQAAQTSSASQRAVAAFRRAAEGRNAMQAAQAAARAAAQAAQSNVPNGLGQGGLQVAEGVTLDPSLWIGAKGPTQTTSADGRTAVSVDQTSQQAILTWDSFNVGRDTDLTFNQQGADWVALNRVTDASADPTRILGSIKAAGSVYILNRNGVIFGGASQVNVRNLVASSARITDDQFLNRGLYSSRAGGNYLASFTDAGGAVSVEAGARIVTNTPTSVTAGGGFVLLMGTQVTNQGSITTPRGQTLLAAGDDFLVRRGFGTEENPYSTTRGNEVRGLIDAGSTSGAVTNAGQIEAAQGDITLAGRTIRQNGVMVATTSVNQRGTIHLLNSASDAEGSVTLGGDSLTLILPELDSKDTALNGQRDALITASDKANLNRLSTVTGGFDDRSLQADRQDQGRVEIVTGGDVVFEGGSQTMANGGQVAVQANTGRITAKDGASIDVSGTMGVALDMASNSIQVNVQGNELRDSPDNRDSAALKNQNVWIDVRDLILLPSGTGGYDGDRWYTPGGLFEVGGYLANTAHGVGEWTAVGGTITLAAQEVMAEQGAEFDISGGSLDYAAGYVRSSRMLGVDGRMYDVRNAPAGMTFVGVGNAFMRKHDRWGSQYSEVFNNRLFSRGTTMRWEDGYSVGRDAGKLILSAPTAVMEATILAGVTNGERQTQARADGVTDGYQLGQHTVAEAGTLAVGGYTALGRTNLYTSDIRIGDVAPSQAAGEALPADRANTVWLDAEHLSQQGLGGLELATRGKITLDADLTLANGGVLDLTGPIIDINATVTARGGTVRATNTFSSPTSGTLNLAIDGKSSITLHDGATLDLRGLWTNLSSGPTVGGGLARLDGGSVTLQSIQDLVLETGSTIDTSSGAAILATGAMTGGKGGDVTLASNLIGASGAGQLTLGADIKGYGVNGGGVLTLHAAAVTIGGAPSAQPGLVSIAADYFNKGFSTYDVTSDRSLTVAEGAVVNVTLPVYRQGLASLELATGGDPAEGLELWTPPTYQADAVNAVMVQRGGASLSLQSGGIGTAIADLDQTILSLGKGSVITVDPGQSINLSSVGQLTLDGTLNAWGGAVRVKTAALALNETDAAAAAGTDRSIWIGEHAVLDVAARAVTAVDAQGRTFGQVRQGGSIIIGAEIDTALGEAAGNLADTHNFVVIRKGAMLDASGAQATLDLAGRGPTPVASDGGLISVTSNNGLYLDGALRAKAGGTGAAGGTLNIALEGPQYYDRAVARVFGRRILTVGATQGPSDLADDIAPNQADTLAYGHGRIGAATIVAGGFGNLTLLSQGTIAFEGDVNLNLGQSLTLYSQGLALSDAAAADSTVKLSAPHVLLAGAVRSQVRDFMVTAPGALSPTRPSDATLTVTADLIDVRDNVLFLGASFDKVTLDSRGDLRFMAAKQSSKITTLITLNDLTLRAAQLYPTTMAQARVVVGSLTGGLGSSPYAPDTTLRIEASGGPAPALPHSLFGSLSLEAGAIEQAGVVRAPLGRLSVGTSGYAPSQSVSLLPGSITSVSGAGLQIPFGGTVDGLTYSYNGKEVSLVGVGGTLGGAYSATMQVGLILGGQSISVEPDAVLDLSGGGDLTGAGFVSGRGGSVDVLRTALANANPGYGYSQASSAVYAIVPGYAGDYAPADGDTGAGAPGTGRQITVGGDIPGLPAGTYTLMPATYATLPGAFRVEIAETGDAKLALNASALPNGSWMAGATLGVANTGVQHALARQVILTPSKVVRTLSLYNEASYADFVTADAVRRGVPRALLPVDTRSLLLDLAPGAGADSFRFDGKALFTPAKGGFGGTVMVAPISGGGANMEVVAAGGIATAGFVGVSVDAGELSALNASRLVLGGMQYINYGQSGGLVDFYDNTRFLYVRSGAVLSAPEVFLTATYRRSTTAATGIVVEQGARINTIGQGKVAYDSADGYSYGTFGNKIFVSNGVLSLIPASGAGASRVDSGIRIGACTIAGCTGETEIYSEGTIALVTGHPFQLDDAVRYGARNLTLAVGRVNVGDAGALADAKASNVLVDGLTLNQSVLDRLLRGDTRYGAPALQTLTLTAASSFDFYGSATLDTIDPVTGKSSLANLVLSTPAIYGRGDADDVATIRTANLTWTGSTLPPAAVVAGGAGTGAGKLNIEAARIEFGYAPNTQPSAQAVDNRLILGFADVSLTASERVTANHKGSLSVYQSQGAYQTGQGYAYSGGNLTITAPLVTGDAGSINKITAGGDLRVVGHGAAATVGGDALGAELAFAARSIVLDTAIVLPSGKLTLDATQDLTLTGQSRIDMSGREIVFNDIKKYSWGGDVRLESRAGDVRQAAGSVIDLSAANNAAGRLTVLALAAGAGVADLQGAILGSASGRHDAGGAMVPYLGGQADIRAQSVGDFAALNGRLNAGQMFGARSFQIKQGDLTIGDGVKARTVNISLDGGALTVDGLIDASGEGVGSINLAARDGLTLTGAAVLDAHGTGLRVDSYGKIIDSPNRAVVSLSSGDGRLTLASGARIDLRHGTAVGVGGAQHDGAPRGTLELNAPRLGGATAGDIAIDASGAIRIDGARSIAVNAVQRYDDADYGTAPAASGRPYQVVDQDYLKDKHEDSVDFINAALGNTALINGKLSGLNNATYRDAFHLRPGVEIVSATPGGDIVVQGDLDLSGYRYASLNPHSQQTNVYGSGEAGALTLRAGGDLNIYGSINDGFAPPPVTQDDNGWLLLPGVDFTGGDIVIPRGGVVLADGTKFAGGKALNYDLPIKAASFAAGVVIPVDSQLNATFNLLAGTVLTADIRDASGNLLFAAGAIVPQNRTLPSGTRFGAGMRLPARASLRPLVWPKGVVMAAAFTLNGALTLPHGALLPAETNIKLPDGVTSVNLRPSVDSRQGALWALAPMLPEGSQSTSLVLVAGADTAAADTRALNPYAAHGDLLLADSHYGVFNKLMPPKSKFAWSQQAVDDTSGAVVLGQQITDQEVFDLTGGGYTTVAALCEENPYYCQVIPSFVWTEEGSMDWYGDGSMTGKPIDFAEIGYDALCTDLPSYCQSLDVPEYALTPSSALFSVVRTGAADMALLSAGDLRMSSLFGVYTAGTSSSPTGADDPYNLPRPRLASGKVLVDPVGGIEKFVDGGPDNLARAWYPTGGGNLTITTGGDFSGEILTRSVYGIQRPDPVDSGYDSETVGNWLWRQGTGGAIGGGKDQATAWWINFGSYVATGAGSGADRLVGFTGFGTLGGGDLSVDVGGDAGVLSTPTLAQQVNNQRTQGLVLAVGSTGRVGADGSLMLTGGGDLNLRIGGRLNPGSVDSVGNNGGVINLRGQAQLRAGSMGAIQLTYFDGTRAATQAPGETRPFDPFTSTLSTSRGGLTLTPGDAVFNLDTTGDLAVAGAEDPGRAVTANETPFNRGGAAGVGQSWFSLWTDNTAINLFSGGGNVTPFNPFFTKRASDTAWVYPSILSAVAANGSLYYGYANMEFNPSLPPITPVLLAPSANARLEFLAGNSIYAGGYMVGQSGASAQAMATPFRPAFSGTLTGTSTVVQNVSTTGNPANVSSGIMPLFAFGPDTASADWNASQQVARFYAVTGDLIGVNTGRIVRFDPRDRLRAGQVWYQGAQPVWMLAGRDIVSTGNPLGKPEAVSDDFNGVVYSTTGNLFVHGGETDISVVSAGRDILHGGFNVAGPGTLEITAGRNILMEDKVGVVSVGPVVSGDTRPGAGIAIMAGMNGVNWGAVRTRYLDPAKLADPARPLADQPGMAVKTYDKELIAWLGERYGFKGASGEALVYFDALAPEQQRVFLRQVYYAETREGGREYNAPDNSRFASYLRGREMIATLFPDKDEAGKDIERVGDIIMFGGAGVHTDFGGDIEMMAPGGQIVVGVQGAVPPSTAGIVTQGEGDIRLFSEKSLLLGLSRIMTTFGGSIFAWSEEGDINAGRGAKSTIVFTPARRSYDVYGNVALAPVAPSSGAGIATLNPIPEVASGDIDLIAPQGTIDAGEAGIRVSGNINLAALQVLNAANIQVQGDSAGIPLPPVVNTGALTAASSATTSVIAEAARVAERARPVQTEVPLIVTVRLLGFGDQP